MTATLVLEHAPQVAAGERFDYPAPLNGTVENMAWSPDGERLAVLVLTPVAEGAEGSLHLLRGPEWDVERVLPLPSLAATTSLAWAADSRKLAVAAAGWAQEWDAADGYMLAEFTLPDTIPLTLRLDAKQMLVTHLAENGRTIETVDTYGSGSWQVTLPEEMTSIAWAGWHARLGFILALEDGFALGVWHDDRIATLSLPPGLVERPGWSHVWSRDGHLAAAVESVDAVECALIVWDGGAEARTARLELEPLGLFGASWSPNGDLIAAATGEEILVFESETLQVRSWVDSFYTASEPLTLTDEDGALVTLTTEGFTRSHSWSPDGRWLAAGNVGGLRVWPTSGL